MEKRVAAAATQFESLVVLAAEMDSTGALKRIETRAPASAVPAVRVNGWRSTHPISIIAGVGSGDVLQLDADVPTSQLGAYAEWLAHLRQALAPRKLVVTALMTWVHAPAFARVAANVDGIVLQLHAIEADGLFDARRALAATRAALNVTSKLQVALPTFMVAASVAQGRVTALRGEAPRSLSVDRYLFADPIEVRAFLDATPVRAIIWYRLPMPGDTMSWSEETSAAVRDGTPLHAAFEWSEHDGDWWVTNTGNAPARIAARPLHAAAYDFIDGCVVQAGALDCSALKPLLPGRSQRVGWAHAAP